MAFETPQNLNPETNVLAQFLDNFGKTMANARQSELEMAWKKYQTDREAEQTEFNAAQQFVLGVTPQYEGIPLGQKATSTDVIRAPAGVQKYFGIGTFQAKDMGKKKLFKGMSLKDALTIEGMPTPEEFEAKRINLRKQSHFEAAALNPKLTADVAGNILGMNTLDKTELAEYKANQVRIEKELWEGSAYPQPKEYATKFKETIKKITGQGGSETKTLESEFPIDLAAAREEIKNGQAEWKVIKVLEGKYGKKNWLELLLGVKK